MSRHPLTYIFVFFILLFVYSKFGPNLPISITTQEKGLPLVVEGTGKAVTAPNVAKVSFGIEVSGVGLTEAQSLSSEKSKALVSALKNEGVNEKDIKTTTYNIYPDYDYSEGQVPKIIGYRVSINYEVTIKDIKKVNEILVLSTQNGANMVGGVSFEVSEEEKEKLLDEARSEAAENAKLKAESLAKAAGVSLGKILSISEYSSGGSPRPMFAKLSAGGDLSTQAPEITPGETELSVTVSISYEIR